MTSQDDSNGFGFLFVQAFQQYKTKLKKNNWQWHEDGTRTRKRSAVLVTLGVRENVGYCVE